MTQKLSEIIRDWATRYAGNPDAEAVAREYDAGRIGITEAVLSLTAISSLSWWGSIRRKELGGVS